MQRQNSKEVVQIINTKLCWEFFGDTGFSKNVLVARNSFDSFTLSKNDASVNACKVLQNAQRLEKRKEKQELKKIEATKVTPVIVEDKPISQRANELPHNTISDAGVKKKVEDAPTGDEGYAERKYKSEERVKALFESKQITNPVLFQEFMKSKKKSDMAHAVCEITHFHKASSFNPTPIR